MSNCITANTDVVLRTQDFPGIKPAQDTDGNRIYQENDEWILSMAQLTTWREWFCFIDVHVWPHAASTLVRFKVEVIDLDDNHTKQLITFKNPRAIDSV